MHFFNWNKSSLPPLWYCKSQCIVIHPVRHGTSTPWLVNLFLLPTCHYAGYSWIKSVRSITYKIAGNEGLHSNPSGWKDWNEVKFPTEKDSVNRRNFTKQWIFIQFLNKEVYGLDHHLGFRKNSLPSVRVVRFAYQTKYSGNTEEVQK